MQFTTWTGLSKCTFSTDAVSCPSDIKKYYRKSSKNSANSSFIEKFLVQIFGGKICYELKINYFTPKLEGCTVYYSCVLVYWSCSRQFRFSWPCWALKAWLEVIMSIWMTGLPQQEMNSNWRLKNLTDMTGTLWRSKSVAILSAVCLTNSRRLYTISPRMVAEAILGRREATIFEFLRGLKSS